ncbi:MAG: LysR family transcriptional regulator [Candidatus Paracaedibacter sp.]
MNFNLDKLRSFIVVGRTGNLSTAAREIGISQPNLGRQMTALGKEVGLTLFVRHSRGIVLTKQGEEFLALCYDIVGRFVQGTDLIREKDFDPSGSLKVVSEPWIIERILEKISTFSQKFPNINFSFFPITEVYQLQIGHSDVALITGTCNDPDIIQLPLCDMVLRIYASPTYLRLYGTPKAIEDLKSHKIIIYGGEGLNLFNSQLTNDIIENQRRFIAVTDSSSMDAALTNGLGIGCSRYNKNSIENNLLVDVFPGIADKIIPYYFAYHRRLEGSPKIKVFYEFLKEEVVGIWQRPDKR